MNTQKTLKQLVKEGVSMIKTQLFNDHFQNYKVYGIPKAQLIIADIPYNIGNNAYGSSPQWYIDGDNKNGESEISEQLQQVLHQVKRCAPTANRKTKALMHRVGHEPMESLLDDAARDFADAVASEEGMEGTKAFVEKRLPNWAQ